MSNTGDRYVSSYAMGPERKAMRRACMRCTAGIVSRNDALQTPPPFTYAMRSPVDAMAIELPSGVKVMSVISSMAAPEGDGERLALDRGIRGCAVRETMILARDAPYARLVTVSNMVTNLHLI